MSAAPTTYIPDADFSTLAATPITSAGLPGTELDTEFAEIASILTATQARLAELQRDDGAVRNGVVGFLAMSADVLAAFASIGSNYRGQWSAGQDYVSGDLVISGIDNYPYLCGGPHTSSADFNSDFSAGVWAILGYRPTTDSLVVNTFSGTGAQTAFSLTKNPVDENNTQVYVAGVYQKKSTYSIAGTSPAVLTFAVAPAAAPNNIEVVIGVSAELINNVVTIPDNSVGTAAIINLNVTTGKLADLSVTTDKISALGVTTGKLADLSVTTGKIAALAVTSDKIAGAAIDSTKLAANAVQTANIQAGAVANAQLMIGAVDATKLATDAVETLKIKDAAVTAAKLAADVGVLFVPAGAVMPFAMNSAPTGWLAASGTAVSRTTYATLFAAISTTYGVGDGSTTFNLPDLRGYFVRGSGTNSDATESGTFGAKQADAFEAHTHLLTLNQNSTSNGTTTAESSFNGPATGNATTSSTGDTETRPKNIAMLYCIKH
jgi:microcystin-dependent protein